MNIPISQFTNFKPVVPVGDSLQRMVCQQCEWIHYENPRVIVAALCLWKDQVLLCRRAIAPRYGFWTLPGGFLENGETIEQGTLREVREEARATVTIESLLATYSVARIGQVHMVYVARMQGTASSPPEFSAGDESLDVRLFPLAQDGLPWDELAFPVNHWALTDYLSLGGGIIAQPFSTRPEHLNQRMSNVPHHPDFPPPESATI